MLDGNQLAEIDVELTPAPEREKRAYRAGYSEGYRAGKASGEAWKAGFTFARSQSTNLNAQTAEAAYREWQRRPKTSD